MGWKTLKDEYRIGHIVQVKEKGICIGSHYVHDLIVIGFDGRIQKTYQVWDFSDPELRRYLDEFAADPDRLKRAVLEVDPIPQKAITVYTYRGYEVIEKQCETPGWPNITVDGELIYDNAFSTDRNQVVEWMIRDARYALESLIATRRDMQGMLAQIDMEIQQARAALAAHQEQK